MNPITAYRATIFADGVPIGRDDAPPAFGGSFDAVAFDAVGAMRDLRVAFTMTAGSVRRLRAVLLGARTDRRRRQTGKPKARSPRKRLL